MNRRYQKNRSIMHGRAALQRKHMGRWERQLYHALLGDVEMSHMEVRKQEVILDRYIADFLVDHRIVVEADGVSMHGTAEAIAYDSQRDIMMLGSGLSVVRFSNKEIEDRIWTCVRIVADAVDSWAPYHRSPFYVIDLATCEVTVPGTPLPPVDERQRKATRRPSLTKADLRR